MDNRQPLTSETITRAVHRALHHLYDPVELRLNPLTAWLGLRRGDTAAALRSALLEGIDALKPGPRVPEDSNAWRVYQVLCYRFEEQSSQEEVASQMAVSDRQVRRLEHTAIRALAAHLVGHYGLAIEGREPAESASGSPESASAPVEAPDHERELDWLRKSYNRETADVYQLVTSALKTAEAMFAGAGGTATAQLPPGLSPVLGQATTLRQILLNLLLAAAEKATAPEVRISAASTGSMVELLIAAHPGDPAVQGDGKRQEEYLLLARQLAELSGGAVRETERPGAGGFEARLLLPAAQRIPVLVVDDNEDSLQLFHRSLEGSRFQFSGTREPLKAIQLATEISARVMILDIMLPEVDGWELLGRIRTHPALNGVPVVISTILPHEQLALSLGAAGFLRKPVNREALLEMLDRLVEP